MKVLRVVAVAVVLAGCGRYRPPLPPEMLAPASVEQLVVTPSTAGVAFAWSAAEKDRRGKELESSTGYSIERKEIAKRGDETDPSVEFSRVGFVQDTHVAVREKLRAEARAQGKVGRNIKSPPEYTTFSFTDRSPEVGKTYIYQIVPINQGRVEGQVGQQAKVVFQGPQSAVVMTTTREVQALAALEDEQQ